MEFEKQVLDLLPPPGTKVAVGMSGGVDSSMAVWLLKQRGCEVIGLTMSLWNNQFPLQDTGVKGCFGPGEEQEIEMAKSVAKRLEIPFHVIPLADEYNEAVLEYFRQEYLAGRTPNPCVRCNRTIKFGFLIERAEKAGIPFDYFATGHYARVHFDPMQNRYLLLRGIDLEKDQSYFLAMLQQEQLKKIVFPLGNLTKSQIRHLARSAGFPQLAEQSESQDFLESNKYDVLFREEEVKGGDIVDENGHILGKHHGIIHYTIGQRKGLGIGGAGEPYYVIGLDPINNRVIVGRKPALLKQAMKVIDCNWVSIPDAPDMPMKIHCKIRLRHEPASAQLEKADEHGKMVRVTFDEPQSAITPGQTAVFYDNDIVLGAGTIDSAEK